MQKNIVAIILDETAPNVLLELLLLHVFRREEDSVHMALAMHSTLYHDVVMVKNFLQVSRHHTGALIVDITLR